MRSRIADARSFAEVTASWEALARPEIEFVIELALDAQRWVRTGPLGSPLNPGTLKGRANPRGF